MIRSVRVRREADLDIIRAAIWYETQRPGLGAEFLEALDALFDSLAAMPYRGTAIRADVRRALLRRFDYCVDYQVRGLEVIVLAVTHQRRFPPRRPLDD